MTTDERVALLHKVSFCADLPRPIVAMLAAMSQRIERPAGTVVQLEGEPAEAMYIVVQGRVKITRLAANGREQVLNVVGAGQHFNTVPVFDHGPCPANAEALTHVELLLLPTEAMRTLVEQHPPLALALLREFAGRLRHLVNLVDELALHTVQGRLAGLLLQRARATPNELEPLTQAEMAARLGTVREMIGRVLKQFELQGLIRLERGAITVLDPAGLALQAEE